MNDRPATSASLPLIATGSVVSLVLLIVLVVVLAGGAGELARWYANGGFFMHFVLLIAMAQVGVLFALGLASRKRPLPIWLFIATPVLAALAGLGGSHVGLSQAMDAIHSAPPDMIVQMWAACIGIADNTRQLGYLTAGCGGLGLVAVGLALRPSGNAPEAKADAFAATLLASLGAVGGVWAIGAAFIDHHFAAAHEVLASAPPDLKLMMLTSELEGLGHAELATLIGVGIAAVVSALFLAKAASGAGEWVSRRGSEGFIAVLAIVAVVGADVYYGVRIRDGQDRLQVINWAEAPGDLPLPVTSSRQRHRGRGVTLILDDAGVRIGAAGQVLPNREATFGRLAAAFEREGAGGDGMLSETSRWRIANERQRREYQRGRGRPEGGDCGEDALPALTLAIAEGTPMTEVNALAAGLRDAGACEVEILGRATDDGFAFLDDPTHAGLLEPVRGILGISRIADRPGLPLRLEKEDAPAPAAGDQPPLHLRLQVERDRIRVLTGLGRVERDPPSSRETLGPLLVELKDAYPDENRVWIGASNDASLSDLVAAIDLAREVRTPEGESRVLFDDVTWAVSKGP